jgi:hypothetical protein
MALKGALDFEFRVEKKGREVQLINTKMKDAEAPKDMFFSFRQVELVGNANSAVLDSTEAPERELRLTPTQRLAQATYESAAVKSGIWDDGEFAASISMSGGFISTRNTRATQPMLKERRFSVFVRT